MILGGYTKMWMARFLQESIDEEDIMQSNNKKKLTSYYVHQLEKHFKLRNWCFFITENKKTVKSTPWNVSAFGVILVRISPYSI